MQHMEKHRENYYPCKRRLNLFPSFCVENYEKLLFHSNFFVCFMNALIIYITNSPAPAFQMKKTSSFVSLHLLRIFKYKFFIHDFLMKILLSSFFKHQRYVISKNGWKIVSIRLKMRYEKKHEN